MVVVTLDGRERAASAHVELIHLSSADPRARGWRVAVRIPELRKEDVPIGSRIMASEALRDALLLGREG